MHIISKIETVESDAVSFTRHDFSPITNVTTLKTQVAFTHCSQDGKSPCCAFFMRSVTVIHLSARNTVIGSSARNPDPTTSLNTKSNCYHSVQLFFHHHHAPLHLWLEQFPDLYWIRERCGCFEEACHIFSCLFTTIFSISNFVAIEILFDVCCKRCIVN